MDTFYRNTSRQKTNVTIFATYNLIKTYLKLLIEGDQQLNVINQAGTMQELLKEVSHSKPDVILICLLKNEGQNIDIIQDLFQAAPETKIVILSSPDSLLDKPAALKLGVTGFVGTNQNEKVLIRAIRQVSEGEVWVNQKLIAELLNDRFAAGRGKNKNDEFFKEQITPREIEIIKLIGLGMRNKDISKKLYISEATVRCHLSSIYGKLNIDDRLNLAIYAHQQGLIQFPVN